jgi:hypothetical protein
MRRKNLPEAALIIGALVLSLAVAGCDLLSNKPEIDVEQAIDDAVREANAPVINVEVSRTMAGISNPIGSLAGIKQGIPFRLNFSVNPNYGFIRWAAAIDGTALGRDQVEFSAPDRLETMVTVHINPGAKTVLITPVGEGANSVDDFYVFPEPADAGTSPVYHLVPQEHYVQIRFSKPVTPGSLRFANGGNFGGDYVDSWPSYSQGGGSPYMLPFGDPGRSFNPRGIFDTEFRHIIITGSVNPPFGYSGFYLENFFYPAVLSADGRTLTLWTRSLRGGTNNGKPAFQALEYSGYGMWESGASHLTITVTVEGSIQDESGLAMGVSKSFSYQVTRNNGVAEVPAYTSSLGYGSGNIFPNSGGGSAMILEEKTRGSVINSNAMIKSSSTTPLEVPADGEEHWAYVLFQSYNTRWRVAGARIVDKPDFTGSTAYVTQAPGQVDIWISGSDVPLLGETLPGESDASSLLTDIVLRDKLVSLYRQKMKDNPGGYSDILPVYVVRYRLRGHTPADFKPSGANPAGNKKILLAFARVTVEPPLDNFPAGITSEVSFGNNVNRAPYPSLSAAWLHVQYAAP